MKKLKTLAICSIVLILIAFLMLGYFQSWSNNTRYGIVNENGGFMDTASLDQQMFSAIIFYFTSAFTMLVLGIAGSILSIAKWLNLPELKEVKEGAGEQHD